MLFEECAIKVEYVKISWRPAVNINLSAHNGRISVFLEIESDVQKTFGCRRTSVPHLQMLETRNSMDMNVTIGSEEITFQFLNTANNMDAQYHLYILYVELSRRTSVLIFGN